MKIIRLEEIDSTNNYIKRNIEKLENYDIVSAEIQTAGRGRRGNNWVSTKGMALFSYLIKEEKELDINTYTKIPMIVGISVLKALKRIEENDYKFKWTNDIYFSNKKLCGILVEKINNNFIVGIGINVNNKIPTEIADIAISLRKNYEIDHIIKEIVIEFKKYYNDFLNGAWKNILNEINSYNFLKNKMIKIKINEEYFVGKALNIDIDGRIEIEIQNEIKKFNVGEITIEKGYV